MRSILITGCSSGIGLDAARTLQSRGWTVIASCRAQADVDRLNSEGLFSVRLDYEDEASLAPALAQTLAFTDGRLDALFNNGAYGIPGAVEDLPTDALRQIFEANLFGWHALTRLVLPVMRAQGTKGEGRIIQCSSVLGITAMPWRGAYNATKFALEGLTDTMRREMRDTDIKISTIEPGPISTDFRKNAAKQFDKWIDWETAPRAEQYRKTLVPRLRAANKPDVPDAFELEPEAVTKKLLHALEASRPRPHYYVTTPTYIAVALRRLLPVRVQDFIWSKV